MITKKNRNRRQKTRKQRGGLKCTEPATWTPFKWSANSCWLDSFLMALLHHSDISIDGLISKSLDELNEQIEIAKEYNAGSVKLLKNKLVIMEKMQYIRAHLRNTFSETFDERNSEKSLSKMREDIRSALSTCPTGQIFKKGRFSSISEIWNFISTLINIPRSIKFIEKMDNGPVIEGSLTYIEFTGFNLLDTRESFNIYDKITDKQYQDGRTYQYKRFGKMLPIDIERMAGDTANSLDMITVPISIQEYMDLKTAHNTRSQYRLVSVICNTGGHYVSYIACDEDDKWMFYNDIVRKEDDRIIQVGAFDEWWNTPIPGNGDKFPANYSTWLLYIRQ